jgi:hypothetical protein
MADMAVGCLDPLGRGSQPSNIPLAISQETAEREREREREREGESC